MYSEQAKNRVEKTKKIKDKCQNKFNKQTAQDRPNIDYSQNPQDIMINTFNVMEMKCEIKSDVI
jgi:hypothetical protein